MGAPRLLKSLFLLVTDLGLKSGDLRNDLEFPVWFSPQGVGRTNRSKVYWFLGLRKQQAAISVMCLSDQTFQRLFFTFVASGSQDNSVQSKFPENWLSEASLVVSVRHFALAVYIWWAVTFL